MNRFVMIFGLLLVAGCSAETADSEAPGTASADEALKSKKIDRLSCEGHSSDHSRASVEYRGGATADLTVDRDVCTVIWGFPAGCTPQHIERTLDVTSKKVTKTKISLLLDNDGTDLDIDVSIADGEGTWYAHENDYTYDLGCSVTLK